MQAKARHMSSAQIVAMAELCHSNRLVFLYSLRQRRTIRDALGFLGVMAFAALLVAMSLR